MEQLKFDRRHWLANAHESPFVVDGKRYYHVEGWMQAKKHEGNPEFSEEIRRTPSASQARVMGAERVLWADLDLGKRGLRPEEIDRWDRIKLATLRQGLWAKFEQNRDLAKRLADTGVATLVYDDPDPFYGCGPQGDGENHLGRLLMEVRLRLLSRPCPCPRHRPTSRPPSRLRSPVHSPDRRTDRRTDRRADQRTGIHSA